MSVSEHSIVLSIIGFQLSSASSTPEDNITCYLFLNSQPISVVRVADFNNSVLIPAKSTEDSLQLVFQTADRKEQIGSVSFSMNHFLQNKDNFTQWVTLFDNPKDDAFDGVIGEDDDEYPRVQLQFDITKEETFPSQQKPNTLTRFELYLRQKDLQNSQVTQSMEKLIDREKNNECTDENQNENLTSFVPVISKTEFNSETKSNIRLTGSVVFTPETKRSVQLQSCSPCKNTQSIRSPLQALVLNQAKDLSYKAVCENSRYEDGNFRDDQEKCVLKNRINELSHIIQKLESENNTLKHSEEIAHIKLNHLQIEYEKLRFRSENYEALLAETQQELSDVKDQLLVEDKIKSQLIQDKEELSLLLYQARQAYDLSKHSADEPQSKMLEVNESLNEDKKKLQTEIDELTKDKDRMKEKIEKLEAHVGEKEKIVQALEKEIHSIKQKQEESCNLDLENYVKKIEEKAKYYEEYYKKLMEMFLTSLFDCPDIQFESFEDFVFKVEKNLILIQGQMNELRTTNEALGIKLAACQNKLMALLYFKDTLWGQINDFKHQVSALEKEKESLKNELFKVHENYTKLANKYAEITQVLTQVQQSAQKTEVHHPVIQKTIISAANINKSVQPKVNSHNAEKPDEIDIKLMEFSNVLKIAPETFSKVDKGTYMYNSKKLILKVMLGKLVVKVGQTFRPLQEVLKNELESNLPAKSVKVYIHSEKRSVSVKKKQEKLDLNNIQAVDYMSKEITSERSTSPFVKNLKEGSKTVVNKDCDTKSIVLNPNQQITKNRPNIEQVKLKDLIASRSVERKLSYNQNRSGLKSERETTLP